MTPPPIDGAYDAVVYDLDGTIVRLAVDWQAAAADVVAVYEAAGVAVDGADLWDLLDRAGRAGLRAAVETVLADHETGGARRSDRLTTADQLAALDRPAGVCSLNCEAACRVALSTHDLDGHVDSVVGRDSVPTRKPDPEPLLAAIEPLDARPRDVLFVGDSARDAAAAERAGVDFRYVDGEPSGH